ncbi:MULTISPECIES: hypothetical protein [unclassified Nonomuraea]|uniref:hypothetical protein n=1 Tax=unclassified Nonomuraea TaxID=2593643 RepID=UPI0033D5C3FD
MAGPLMTTTGAALAAGFRLAAGLRGGRPLHPHGLLFDAELHLHGDAARTWGSPFLDERLELRGIARLSRSAGLPPPLPDILGIALRWRQADADAELLLATTGRTTLGRRLLRPATRWAPGLYGSLFPYEARGARDDGGRRVLLGALPARTGRCRRASTRSPPPWRRSRWSSTSSSRPRRDPGSSSASSSSCRRPCPTRPCPPGSIPPGIPSRG